MKTRSRNREWRGSAAIPAGMSVGQASWSAQSTRLPLDECGTAVLIGQAVTIQWVT